MYDWPNIFAILFSPIIALQLQKYLDNHSNAKRRKEEIFSTLMETRAQPISFEHVRALNKIDVAFFHDKTITSGWNAYRDHLNSFPREGNELEKKLWNEKISEKLAKLLSEMSKLLGYNFDETLLIKGAYTPVAHGFLDSEQAALRKGLVEIFAFKNPLKVELVDNKTNEVQ